LYSEDCVVVYTKLKGGPEGILSGKCARLPSPPYQIGHPSSSYFYILSDVGVQHVPVLEEWLAISMSGKFDCEGLLMRMGEDILIAVGRILLGWQLPNHGRDHS
jgi:hypothetical protein